MSDSGLMGCYGGGLVLFSSVEHDPVSGSRSVWILQFRTGSGSDCISKNTQPVQMWISKLHWSLQ